MNETNETNETTDAAPETIAADAVASPKSKKARKGPKLATGKLHFLDPEQLLVIGLDTAHRSRAEHKLWDERATLPMTPEKIQTMLRTGDKVDPVTVNEDGEVIKGRQRTKYAREVNQLLKTGGKLVLSDGKTTIDFAELKDVEPIKLPVRVVSYKDVDLSGQQELGFTENSATTPENALTQAAKIRDYIIGSGTEESPEHSQAEAAVVFACSVGTINGRLDLLKLTPDAREAFVRREATYNEARQIAQLPPEQQQERVQQVRERRQAAGGKPPKAGKGTRETLLKGIRAAIKGGKVTGLGRTIVEWFLRDGDVTNEALAEVLGVRLPGKKEKPEAAPPKGGKKKGGKKGGTKVKAGKAS